MGYEFSEQSISKSEFIKEVSEAIKNMKVGNHITYCVKRTVACKSKTSDVALEYWEITFNNREGHKFKAYIRLSVKWKNGTIDEIQMPFELWDTKKEFLEFLKRECDK